MATITPFLTADHRRCDEVLSDLNGESLLEMLRQNERGLGNGASDQPATLTAG